MQVPRGKMRKLLWNKECTEYAINLYVNEKMSIGNIAKEMDVSPKAVSIELKRNDVHIRTDREQSLKYTVNEKFFEIIDTEKKAYWLGFMYADGYITAERKHSGRKIGMSLSIKDIERLEAFKKDIEYTGDIKIYTVKQGYKLGVKYGRLIISSEKLASDLEDKGCFEQKKQKINLSIR